MKLKTMFKILLCLLIFIPNPSKAVRLEDLGNTVTVKDDGGGWKFGWCASCKLSNIDKEKNICTAKNQDVFLYDG